MAQEDKQLLLKVLCDGLPYGIKCRWMKSNSQVTTLWPEDLAVLDNLPHYEPYLRDMEDMTEVEKQIYDTLIHSTSLAHRNELNIWLNKKHFNWRGLPEDMYIKVTEENNPYKQ